MKETDLPHFFQLSSKAAAFGIVKLSKREETLPFVPILAV